MEIETSVSPFFTRQNLEVILGSNRRTLDYRIRSLVNKGVLAPIKPGFFLNQALYNRSPNPTELLCYVGNILVPESYISLQYALSKYGILAEGVYALTFVTIRKTRKFLSKDTSFIYRNIKPSLFLGFKPQKIGDFVYQMANPAKALFDYFYLAPAGAEKEDNRFNLSVLTIEDVQEFKDYVDKSGSPKMRKVLKYIIKNMSTQTQQIVNKIRPILVSHGVTKAQLFGSAARNELKPGSDVDILVEFPPKAGLFTVGKLYGDLKDVLGRDVDLVSYKAVHPYIQKHVYSSTVNVI